MTTAGMFRTPFASVQQPAYLDDEDEDGYFGEGVMSTNQGNNSLQARLAAKKAEAAAEKAKAQAGGGKRAAVASMFSSVGTAFGLW